MFDEDVPHLLLDDRFFHKVNRGIITASLRIGERAISPGRLRFIATRGGYLPVMVYIDRLIDTTFAEISDTDAILAGYVDAETARQELLDFYPNIQPNTPMTVMRFEKF